MVPLWIVCSTEKGRQINYILTAMPVVLINLTQGKLTPSGLEKLETEAPI